MIAPTSIAALALACFARGVALAQERPYVAYIDPPAVRIGETHEITLHGRNLQNVTGLLSDAPLHVEPAARGADQVTFRIKPSPDAWPGIHQLRAITPTGASAPRLLLIDDLPATRQAGDNHSPGHAQRVSPPIAVLGRTRRGEVDYYRFDLKEPTALTFEVVARRFGTGPEEKLGGDETGRLLTIDPVVRLLDSAGRELAFVDDTPGAASDLRFRYCFRQAGQYVLAIYDGQYHGGLEHQYVLRVGDFPEAAVCFPAGGTLETGLPITVPGSAGLGDGADSNLAPYHSSVVFSADEALDGVRWVSAQSRCGLRSLALANVLGHGPELNEIEPNDAPQQTQLLSVPSTVNGRLQRVGDVDRFGVELRKGQKVRATGAGRSVGSSVWIAARVLGPDGSALAGTLQEGSAAPEISATDPRLDLPPVSFEAKADGRHVVQVERRLGRPGPAAVYRLQIEPFGGGFALRAKSDFVAVPRGGRGALNIDVLRDQYSGSVELGGRSTLAGTEMSTGSVSGADSASAAVVLSAPAEGAQTAAWLVVAGRARVGDRELTASADVGALYDAPGGLRPNQGHFFFLRPLPAVLTHRIAVVVTDPAPFSVELPETRLTVETGATSALPVVCRRSSGFNGPVVLRVEGLPKKLSVETPPVADGAQRSEVKIKVAGDAAPGQHVLALVGEATIDGRKLMNATPALTVEVRTAKPAGEAGKSGKSG